MKGGLVINIAPIKPNNAAVTYLHPTFSPIKTPINTTNIGDINIIEIASPKGKETTPSNHVKPHKTPILALA